ncbi:MAG TPA: site-2 protease family protein [Roseiflexaceae bacterium]|nr:site-2 protease family protein [Roseiflexaceae bacterium]
MMGRRQFLLVQLGSLPLRAHWSWPPVLALLCVGLAPLYGVPLRPEGLALSVFSVVLLYASVLIHELAHAAAALRAGLPVQAVVLFAFGGWTEIDERRLRASDELMIAAAGPLASLALACGWWGIAVSGATGALHALTTALALTNLGLMVVNLLPCYPLDGGRVLKSALWYLLDNEIEAARVAALIARACGWCMAAAGLLYVVVSGDVAGGLITALAGYSVGRTASEGVRHFLVQHTLRQVRVADVMQRVFRAVTPDLPLDQFVGQFVLGQPDQSFPVVDAPESPAPQALLGLMTLRDLKRFSLNQWGLMCVRDAMTPAGRVPALAPETSADAALRTLLDSGLEQLPVLVSGQLQGMLRRRDLATLLQGRMQKYG